MGHSKLKMEKQYAFLSKLSISPLTPEEAIFSYKIPWKNIISPLRHWKWPIRGTELFDFMFSFQCPILNSRLILGK